MDRDALRTFRSCRKYIFFFSILGLGLSYYSILISEAKSNDSTYVAFCDISESISCSDVLTSQFSKGFGLIGLILGENSPLYLSNGYYGLGFYTVNILFSLYPAMLFSQVLFMMSIFSIAMSIYLGFVLFYILQDLCIVCVSTYLINFILLIFSIRNRRAVKKLKDAAQAPDYSSFLDGKTVKKRV